MNSILLKIKIISIATIALSISACATSLTRTFDTADNVDLSDFKTYAWVSAEPRTSFSADAPDLTNPVNHHRIRAEIESELQGKGYVKVPFDDADLAVSYSVGARDKLRVRKYYNDIGYSYYGYHRGFSRFSRFNRFSRYGRRFNRFGSSFGGYVTADVQTITEGTIIVDVFDNQRKEAIWHGAASKRLSGPDSGRQLVSEAVGSLLEEFPQSTKMADVMDKLQDKETIT